MDMELMTIQINQDFSELAEEYLVAASNERLWAKGSDTDEEIQMHEQNAEHNHRMGLFYSYLASRALDLIESFDEEGGLEK
jgi:hypothetical protein